MLRTIGIWVFGLLASALIGGMIAARLETGFYSRGSESWGAVAAMCAFACLRLWLAPKNSK